MRRPNPPTVLSVTALVIAVLGATPVGQAARDAIPALARNADKVDGIHAAKKPKAGQLLALGANKKFPVSVVPAGPPGPKGDPGEKGDKGDAGGQGPPGLSGLVYVEATSPNDSTAAKSVSAQCPTGKKVVGGGGRIVAPTGSPVVFVGARPLNALNHYWASAVENSAYAGDWRVIAVALCATVAP